MATWKKYLTLLIVCLLGISSLMAQRNSISVFYGPLLSRIYPEDVGSTFFNGHFAAGGVNALIGYTWGFAYERRLSAHWQLGIGGRYALRGQRSPHYFHSGPARPAVYPDGYGGGAYDLKIYSSDLSLWATWQPWVRGPWALSVKTGPIVSLLDNAFARDYVIEKHTGIKRKGCCTSYYSLHNEPYFERMSRHFQRGNARIGGILGASLQYAVSDWLSLSIMPEVVYLGQYSKLNSSLPLSEASIWAMSSLFMLDFHF